MAEMFAILPRPSEISAFFWESCNQGVLKLQRCDACAKLFYYPRLLCPACGRTDLEWVATSGRGTIVSLTEVRTSFQGSHWETQLPYTVLLVALEEGPQMVSRLIGDDRDLARIGDSVAVSFVAFEGQCLPYFKRVAIGLS